MSSVLQAASTILLVTRLSRENKIYPYVGISDGVTHEPVDV